MEIKHDPATDTVLIEGVTYSCEVFRCLALASPGSWLRIEERRDGVITVFSPSDETEKAFDLIVGRGSVRA